MSSADQPDRPDKSSDAAQESPDSAQPLLTLELPAIGLELIDDKESRPVTLREPKFPTLELGAIGLEVMVEDAASEPEQAPSSAAQPLKVSEIGLEAIGDGDEEAQNGEIFQTLELEAIGLEAMEEPPVQRPLRTLQMHKINLQAIGREPPRPEKQLHTLELEAIELKPIEDNGPKTPRNLRVVLDDAPRGPSLSLKAQEPPKQPKFQTLNNLEIGMELAERAAKARRPPPRAPRPLLPVASSTLRLLAGLIDLIPIAALAGLFFYLGFGQLEAFIPADIAFLPEHLGDLYNYSPQAFLRPYFVVVMASLMWQGISLGLFDRSLGKAALRMQVVDDEGQAPGSARTLLRVLGYALSFATLGLGWGLAFALPSRRTLHDLVSGTYVIRKSAQRAAPEPDRS